MILLDLKIKKEITQTSLTRRKSGALGWSIAILFSRNYLSVNSGL